MLGHADFEESLDAYWDRMAAWGFGAARLVFTWEAVEPTAGAYDETFDLPASIEATGVTQVVFSKVSGLPQATGTLTLTAASIGEARTVTVNESGMVDY